MAEEETIPKSSNNLTKIFIILLIIVGFITTFVSGYIIATLLVQEQKVPSGNTNQTKNIPSVTPYPTNSNSQTEQETTKFLPGKTYFEDTVMLVTNDKPQISIIATVSRLEQEKDFIQNTRISYYDGSSWIRKSDSMTTPDSTIVSGNLVKSWETDIDPSRVLKQTVKGDIAYNNTALNFATGVLQNELGIRSLPGYTKFMSNGTGTLTVNGTAHQAYVLYSRIYSLNASDIQFYNQPFGVTTDWIAFWDTQGNFYHVDNTGVDKPTPIYQTHQIGIMEDVNGSVTKTFHVSVQRDAKNPPTQYTVTFDNPVGATLQFNRINGVNKAPKGSYTWYMGNIEGTITNNKGESMKGIGLVEYIHD